ncbi:hypothetical protein BGZ93_007043 [Podila epicladia]|nr:hypothetical protein BGZ92_001382 [Podila epicladia]KAG0094569.1 hypothetical protein BGZ93_007043 [Podila epicladia]
MSSFDPVKPTDAAIRDSLTNSADPTQDITAYAFEPPTYDEAIGFASDPAEATLRNVRPIPCDGLQGEEAYDMEDEQDYEESRPLRTGVVPNAPAQYTFIQPQDHTRQKWWKQSKFHTQKYHYHKSTEESFSDYKRQRHHCHTPVQTLGGGHQAFTGAPPTTSASGPSTQGPYTPPSHCPQPYAAASGTSTPAILEGLPPMEAKSSSIAPSAPPGINILANSHSTYAPPNVPPPPLSQQLPTYQRPAEPFAGIPAVHENQGLMNAQDISIADFVRKSSGDESVDPILENDPYQLYRFFVAHNDRPEMYLLITGYHVETRKTVSKDSKGKTTTSTRLENVEDFRIEFDLTPFVDPRGVLYTSPDPETGQERPLRQVFDDHARDDNEFKELHLMKAVQWDYEELTRAIIHAVRSAHYRFNVEVSFPLKNDRVKVASSSPLAKFMRNPWTKAFCFLGVVGVVFYPIVRTIDPPLQCNEA